MIKFPKAVKMIKKIVIWFRSIPFYHFLPLIHLYIELPFISIRTMIMGHAYEKACREYIILQIRIWKWHCEFELYDTDRRIMERKGDKK